MQRMRMALATLLVLGLGAAPAHARYLGQNQVQYRRHAWRTIESDHFRVCFSGGLDSLALRVLDLAEQTDGMFARRLGRPLARRVTIILYGSPGELAQTNLTPERIGTGAGGFVEPFQDRVVLTFMGSQEGLRRDLVHELTHAYLFDLLSGGSASGLLARHSACATPPWFAEGLAGYLSLGSDPDAEVSLRDGIIEGTLPRLEHSGGRPVGPQGRSAIRDLVDRYGEDRLRELLQRMQRSHDFARAFRRVIGVPVRTFDEQWRDRLRREYWPAAATRQEPEHFARRLTDHRRDGSTLNTAPAVSPQGDRIAWLSDRRQYTDVDVMSAHDGKVLRRVLRGERAARFEVWPSLRSSIAWSPDGLRLALTSRSGGRDVLDLVMVADGRVRKRIVLDCDALASPAWSPVAESLVVVGLKDGRSDLWLVDAGSGEARRLTADAGDEQEPCWTPDGRTITFASDRPLPGPLEPERAPQGFGRHGLFDLDLVSGAITRRLATAGDDHSPAWSPDGRKLAFVSDLAGTSDLMLFDTRTRSITPLTELRGGVSSLSWSRQDDQLVFSAFDRGGYDVFALREPVSVDAVLARLRRERPPAVASEAGALRAPADSTRGGPFLERGGSFALPDSVRAQKPIPYRARLSPDYAAGGVLAATGFGFAGSTALAFSDLLGDQRLELAADLSGGSLDRTDVLVRYRYLPYRWDFSAGLFQLRRYDWAHETGTGETLGSPRLGSGRTFGVVLEASRPFDRFRRLDLGLTQRFVERAVPGPGVDGNAVRVGGRYGSASAPSLSLVCDDALWGSTGPVNGGRSNLTLSPSFGGFARGLSYRTASLDTRRYWGLTRGYTLAARLLAGRSDGRDAPSFFVGGFATLRGYPYDGLTGTRLAIVNAELRFPFIERLGAVGPVPLGNLDLRGAVFADAGLAWDRGAPLRLTRVEQGRRRLDSPRASFGAGVRTHLGFMIVKVDAAWPTDLGRVGRPHWAFSIGPEF